MRKTRVAETESKIKTRMIINLQELLWRYNDHLLPIIDINPKFVKEQTKMIWEFLYLLSRPEKEDTLPKIEDITIPKLLDLYNPSHTNYFKAIYTIKRKWEDATKYKNSGLFSSDAVLKSAYSFHDTIDLLANDDEPVKPGVYFIARKYPNIRVVTYY